MHVLITNDDGYQAQGLLVLAQAVYELQWNATIVAPKFHMSGTSRGRIGGKYLPWAKTDSISSFDTFHVEGTPASCVVFAQTSGLFKSFDMCLSGINAGENLGAGLTISGTFGAALEAASYNIKSLAISRQSDFGISDENLWDWTYVKDTIKELLLLLAKKTKQDWKLANINIPNSSSCTKLQPKYTTISKQSYFYDQYNLDSLKIESEHGFDFNKLSKDDDIYALVERKCIGISLLEVGII